ncbi:MAG TPA: hypothetical protein VN875_12050 [Candidatus Binatus sp.]|nr:hypothetical protein [Candidatus Binatus sp.]
MSCGKRFQQSSLLTTRSLGQDAVPFSERFTQLAATGLQLAKPGFDVVQLLGGQLPHSTAGRGPGGTLAEDLA